MSINIFYGRRFFNIRIEKHEGRCTCSHCRGPGAKPWFSLIRINNTSPMAYGLNIPQNWSAWNSWYTIRLPKRVYIRWINPWFNKIGLKCKMERLREKHGE